MNVKKVKVTQNMILRSVASSTAIETGKSVSSIERKLKNNKKKYASLALAD
ncbi:MULTISPECIES: hypothetical protein [unclassified Pseudoalteromonas]|uniref:hypothetical protein n=1 Tax=unclassified Pseudoalteromonas TaxID=194690 RepID=UPI001F24C705|nr:MULTISPECIES: hypothetical protein [unclassified Pseudoalteromonas]MCF2827118.1 hypothetical protein [Pseudoalteromonas sp. OF5H-5]MCF2925869.1 hypothetical protein [Pseudoalteromonas sp. DL2-H1]